MLNNPKVKSYYLEGRLRERGYSFICGVDEAGRGSLSGPVVAGACILDSQNIPDGIKDSKQLSELRRERLFDELTQSAVAWSIGVVNNIEIDSINILNATKKAMQQAVANLDPLPDFVLIDAVRIPDLQIKQNSFIRGDEEILSISAASVIAKVSRDRMMRGHHEIFPQYNWKSNKGYPTKEHLTALMKYGPSKYHRFTFKGVENA